MNIKNANANCEDEYAKLWQMYGDLEDERDRLREALEWYADPENYWSDNGYITCAAEIEHGGLAREALREAGNELS